MNKLYDLTTLPQRMRYVVNCVLQEVFEKDRDLYYKYGMELQCDLLDAASNWEREECEAAEIETQVKYLAKQLKELDPNASTFGNGYIPAARKLIESGWRKVETK
jgi:hypothetical protein